MESTGAPGRIHLSKDVADLLLHDGKSHWVVARDDKVVAKGKGELDTFWLEPAPDLYERSGASDAASSTGSESLGDVPRQTSSSPMVNDKNKGLVDWNVSIIKKALIDVAAYRKARRVDASPPHVMKKLEMQFMTENTTLSEVKEIVSLPQFDEDIAAGASNCNTRDLSEGVTRQLREFVYTLSSMYKDNPFVSGRSCITSMLID